MLLLFNPSRLFCLASINLKIKPIRSWDAFNQAKLGADPEHPVFAFCKGNDTHPTGFIPEQLRKAEILEAFGRWVKANQAAVTCTYEEQAVAEAEQIVKIAHLAIKCKGFLPHCHRVCTA